MNEIIELKTCTLHRDLSASDAELLAEQFACSQPWLTLGILTTGLKNYLLKEDSHLYRYAVQVDKRVVGVICIRTPWLRGDYIELLGLIEDYRGQGIGTELLQWAELQAHAHGNNLWLLTSSFNRPALQFYQAQGFKQIGIIEGLVHPDYDELLLRKRW
jgi:ribosomal protein S18 acetylase RimI-like enzyme